MVTVALLRVDADASPSALLAAAGSLAAAGVAGVGFLDAADLGTDLGATESSLLATAAALELEGVGVVGTQSGLYGFPYHSARRFATLDHLSGGYAGWLVRTTSSGPESLGHAWRSTGDRAAELGRCSEHLEISYRLWDSWEDGAQWPDKETGDFKDDSRIHSIDYVSEAFQVAGPLDVPPSPQRRPVILVGVSTVAEAAALGPWTDVAVVTPGPDGSAPLVVAAREAGASLVLLRVDDPADPASAATLAAAAGADGVAPVLSVEAALTWSDVASAPAGGTFAERLGLATFEHGSRTA
ncbi:LLM class flavin-dependent oxidoreductase [Nocardioides bruguierae]|uniref:LLM class flavin-dependent oxidoreductase n=1 Tax=Nocardioides bruguierae TaxID=2945102 RepID=A0A9X2D896_9ACTN|nr:LLM class flavin-dependent oxidoreductase [Nocardioides bruguierae]MCM0621132.1 LLM class flavin-dependent oxidoreductase [Nocardioides bruguierae]